MTKPTEIHPAIAANLGWDIDAASNDNLVTVVRHRIILEEVVMTREEFNTMNENVKNEESCWNEIEWQDAQWDDYCEERTTYTAFPGDVTSFTDDCVAFLYPEAEWVECFETVKCANWGTGTRGSATVPTHPVDLQSQPPTDIASCLPPFTTWTLWNPIWMRLVQCATGTLKFVRIFVRFLKHSPQNTVIWKEKGWTVESLMSGHWISSDSNGGHQPPPIRATILPVHHPMALWTMATDLTTRQTVWISRNVVKGRPQLNSHRNDRLGSSLASAGIDGYSAVEVAGLHHNYQGKGLPNWYKRGDKISPLNYTTDPCKRSSPVKKSCS